jgi:hypothetical protein
LRLPFFKSEQKLNKRVRLCDLSFSPQKPPRSSPEERGPASALFEIVNIRKNRASLK